MSTPDTERDPATTDSLPPAPSLHHSFRFKLVLLVGAVIVVVGTAVGMAAHRLARSNVQEQIEQRLEDLVASRAALVRTHVNQLESQVNTVVQGTRLQHLLKAFESGNLGDAELRAQGDPIVREVRSGTDAILEFAVTDTNGRVVIATDPALLDADISSDAVFEAGRSRAYLGQPVNARDGRYHAPLAAPFRDEGGRIVGGLFARVDVTPIHSAVSRASRGWASGEVVLAARKDEGEAHYLFSPTLEDGGAVHAPEESKAMLRALRDETGHVAMQDYRGRPVLAAYGPVDESGGLDGVGHSKWGIVAKVDSAEAYAPVERMRDVTIVLTMALGLLVLGITYRIARRFTRPVAELANASLATASDPRAPIDVPVRNDEIGVLAAAFRHMRQELLAHQTLLEQRVADRTSKLQQANEKLETQIAERVRLVDELNAAKEAAEASNRAKSAFLAAMSHEIRTPMNGVVGMAELLGTTPLTAIQRDYLNMVQESADSLLQVINDILDFSRMEAGRFELDSHRFELRELVGNTLRAFADRAHEKGLELAARVDPDAPDAVFGDPLRVRQILVNLIGNAIKFTDAGEVVVDVKADAADGDRVLLRFEVRDTGIGIPPERQAAVFEAFEQGDVSSTRRFGGAGLGLTISARLVDMMGGTLTLDSRGAKGTTFCFNIPVELVTSEEPQVPDAALKGLRVLVVDDNETNCRILEEMLNHWGMRVTALRRAADAFEVMLDEKHRGEPFQLALLDANMPDVDGFTLAERMQADERVRSTIVMMLSSADRPLDVRRCNELGIDVYLLKPIKQSDLLSSIQRALGMRSGAEQRPPMPTPMAALNVLLVEDNLVSQRLVIELLERWGHTVDLASTGEEAVSRFRSPPDDQAFDVILMDVQMPTMDGLEATRQIRSLEQERGGHVPIIAMTAHAMKGDRERCLRAGMDSYLVKPIRASQLRLTLKAQTPADYPLPEPQPAASEQRVDFGRALEQVERRDNVLRSMIGAFLEECPGWLRAMDRAVVDQDADALNHAAHTIKGAAQSLAAGPLAHEAQQLEALGRAGELEEAPELARRVQEEAKSAMSIMNDYLAGKQPTVAGPAAPAAREHHAT